MLADQCGPEPAVFAADECMSKTGSPTGTQSGMPAVSMHVFPMVVLALLLI